MEDTGPLDDSAPLEPPAVRLERELRDIAEQLDDEQWGSESYLLLEEAIDIFLDEDDEEPLQEAIQELEQVLEQAIRPYREAQIVDSEVTAESAVAHKLLMEGMESWLAALEMLRDENAGEQDEESSLAAALERAEHGNRLLIAVQIFNARLQAELASLNDRP